MPKKMKKKVEAYNSCVICKYFFSLTCMYNYLQSVFHCGTKDLLGSDCHQVKVNYTKMSAKQ